MDPGPDTPAHSQPIHRADVVVDAANVVGSRPDGWWRDRAGAATRLLTSATALVGRVVDVPGGGRCVVERVHVVLEGRARTAAAPADAPGGLHVVRAEADGDAAVAALAHEIDGKAVADPAAAPALVVVTADRGLRERLPAAALAVGPRWLRELLDAAEAEREQP